MTQARVESISFVDGALSIVARIQVEDQHRDAVVFFVDEDDASIH